MAGITARFRAWATVFFDELWRLIPAQPVLFPFFFVSGILAIFSTHGIGVPWVVLSLASPTMVLFAWWLIFHQNGKARYTGMWIRTGGDIGQVVVLIADIMMWCPIIPIPLTAIMVGLTVFVFLLVVRDLLALWLVEQLATRLYREVNRDVAAR